MSATRSSPSASGDPKRDEHPGRRLHPWTVAAREAAIVVALGLAIGEAVSFLILAGGGVPGLGVAGALRGGVVLFFLFHHVGIQGAMGALHLPHGAEVPLGLPSGYAVDATVALALLGGMALVLWRLGRAGAIVAEAGAIAAEEGDRWSRSRGLGAARIAVPYAVFTFLLGWTVHATVRFPQTPPVVVHPSHVASLMWPLVLAAVAAFVGGVRSGPGGPWASEWWEAEEWPRRWRGACTGALWILGLGMVFALVGFLAVAAVRFGDTAQYVTDGFSGGPGAGLGVAALAVLAIPNLAVWVMAPAFGGCVQMASGFGFTQGPYCVMSYAHAPSHVLATRDIYWGLPHLGPPPPAFWLFLAVPVAAVVLGTLRGIRAGEARTGREGAVIGLLIGLVFIPCWLVAMLLSTVTVRLVGPLSYVGAGYFRYGPQPLDAIELGLVWGVLGGSLVGWLAGRRAERAAARGP